ncbi:MAG: putative dehydrogenase [Candidatus Pelagisphaera sp.]|jgi:predicted dehydrogenase
MKSNRRAFLKTSATFLAAAPAFVRGGNLNSKLQIASIGANGKGYSDISKMADHKGAIHVAFCDVDLARTEKALEIQPEALVFQDYREMLDQLGDKIDAVTVSTPDHMHAYIALDAMRRGKHVYCQKPLTHSVWEARQMALQAAKSNVITRMGNQIHSHTVYRTAVRAIQSGKIGKVKRVHSWVEAVGHGRSGYLNPPKVSAAIPKSLDWNLWLGVAPKRPYGGDRIYHPWGWRDWQDFGSGALGDFGCHILDPVFTALNMQGAPVEIKATHTGMNDEVWPAQSTVYYLFPGTEYTEKDMLRITWYNGGLRPSQVGSHVPDTTELPKSGSLIIGEVGTLVLPHFKEPRFYPQENYPAGSIAVAKDLNHYHGFVDGCLSGSQPSDGFDYGGPLTEAVQLGNIALRFKDKTLKWDTNSLTFTNLDAANEFVSRKYRKGWKIEPVS